jgi:hypothetical protein
MMVWHAVVMLAWGATARGAEIGDADSAQAARIELLKEENAKIMRTLEKVRGAISYWKTLGVVPDVVGGASSAEDGSPAAPTEPVGAPGPERRLESKVPGGVKVWQGGVLHNFKNAETCPTAWSKCPLGGAPARLLCLLRAHLTALGSAALPGRGRATGHPTIASGARVSRLRSRRFPPRL